MDLLQGVQDGVQQQDHEDIGLGMEGGDFKMPTLEQLVDLIGGANMSEEEKQNLLESITKAQTKPNIAPEASVVEQLLVLVIPLTILIIVFVFFGYKLYKSVVEKERKRDEKRKQKQQKKKK